MLIEPALAFGVVPYEEQPETLRVSYADESAGAFEIELKGMWNT